MPPTMKTMQNAPAFQIRDNDDSNIAQSQGDDAPRFAIAGDGIIVYSNEAFQSLLPEIFQTQDTPIRAKDIIALTGKKTLDTIESGLHKVRIKGKRKSTEFRFDCMNMPDGKSYIIASAVLDDDETPAPKKVKVANNQRRHALGTLEEASDLRRFLNMSNDAMIVAEQDGKILRVNKAFTDILGYDDADLDDFNMLDLLPSQDRPRVRSLIQTLNVQEDETIKIIDFETKATAKDGSTHWIEWRQRKRANLLYCVGRDVTDIKEHEQALIKRQNQLSEAEAIGAMGHWHWDIGQDDILWSQQIYNIYGVDRDEFVPNLDKLNKMIHRRDIGRVVQIFQRAMIEQNNYGMDFRITRPDGEVRYIYCEGRCELDEDGDITGLFGIMQDMTEQTLHEQELTAAKDGAERAYAAKTQFLANMSHELRTPLNAIIGFSEMMQRQLLGPIGNEKYIDYIGGIRESGEHLLDLISDILDMSKIEAGKYELGLEDVNVSKTLGLAAHMMEGRCEDAGVKLCTKGLNNNKGTKKKADKTIIQADRRAFLQITLNLLSNAVKFSNEGGKVWLASETTDDHVIITVRDNGIGIPANKLQSITMPFEQASSSYCRDHEGTGLGLSITKELIELHGGSLKIESKVGEGTNVSVKLPLDASQYQ